MRPLKAIFFDLDGTLLDSIPGIVASLRHALTEAFGSSPNDSTLVSGIGTPLIEQMRVHARSYLNQEPDERFAEQLASAYKVHNLAHHDSTIRCFDGVPLMLEQCVDRGIQLGIVTSKPHELARRGLALCGIERPFQFVIGYDDVTHPKPHPEPVLMALGHLNLRAQDAVFVGDSPHDILSGRRAGVRTIAAGWGPFSEVDLRAAEPTAYFSSISEFVHQVVA